VLSFRVSNPGSELFAVPFPGEVVSATALVGSGLGGVRPC
jgi:hypothetical protein